MDGDITGADLASAMAPSSDAGTAAPGSAASPAATTATTDPGATVPAAAAATTDRSTDPKPTGPIPFDAHKTALENARTKATADWDRDYGWAKHVKREEFTQAVDLAKRASADPVGFMREFLSDLQSNPQHAEALRSEVARALGTGRTGGTAMPKPNVQITDAAGNVVGETYDAAGLAARDAYMFEQWMAKVDAKYAPVVKTHESLAARQQQEHEQVEGQKFASGLLDELRTYPQFEAKIKEIGAEVVRMLQQYPDDDPRVNDPSFLEATTLRAYQRIVTPTLDQSARQAALHDITTKAQHSGVTPGTGAAGAPKPLKDMSWEDGLRHEFARMATGGR